MKVALAVGAVSVLALLGGASVAGPAAAYQRPAWIDTDHDGCNTREELLSAPAPCPPKALAVSIVDPYTGETVVGRQRIQVDHVVPLRWMWDHGARSWPRERWVKFANDPGEVVLTSARQNQAKGDRGPAGWLPPDRSVRCWYAVRWEIILVKYEVVLPVGDRDRVMLDSITTTC